MGMPGDQSSTVDALRAMGTPKRNGRRTSKRAQPASPKCVMLILEDFDEIRAFLARHFTQQGYEVYSSSTLRDALAIAWEEAPQVILIDYDLSGETAIHAIKRLHEAQPQSHVVLVGGPQTTEVEELALAVGAEKVLSKAYGIAEMDRIVESAAHLPTPDRPFMRAS